MGGLADAISRAFGSKAGVEAGKPGEKPAEAKKKE